MVAKRNAHFGQLLVVVSAVILAMLLGPNFSVKLKNAVLHKLLNYDEQVRPYKGQVRSNKGQVLQKSSDTLVLSSRNANIANVESTKTDLGSLIQSTTKQLDDEGTQEDSSEPHEAQDAFNEPKDYSLINQTIQPGDLEITVATWNILAVVKSGQTASGFITFDLATEYPECGAKGAEDEAKCKALVHKDDKGNAAAILRDATAFHAAKKKFLENVLNSHKDIDVLGLQEVDALQERWVWDLASSMNMGWFKGPVYDSGRGGEKVPLKDASYLLYTKSKFSEVTCLHGVFIPGTANRQYIRCTLTVRKGGGKLKIVTGHSASSGISEGDQDTKQIAAFQPSVLFGDFNTDAESAKAALTGLTGLSSHPAASDVPTMRKTAYKFRKLTQGSAKVTKGWPAGKEKTCQYLSRNPSDFATSNMPDVKKYAIDRWCKEGKDENHELKEAYPDTWLTTPLDKVWQGIGCTDQSCKKLKPEAQGPDFVKLVVGQEDAILTAGGATIVSKSQQIKTGPDSGVPGYPNAAWMSDHYLLKAKVRIPGLGG